MPSSPVIMESSSTFDSELYSDDDQLSEEECDQEPLKPRRGLLLGNNYVLGDKIDSGGHSRVYQATDLRDGRVVAIKASKHGLLKGQQEEVPHDGDLMLERGIYTALYLDDKPGAVASGVLDVDLAAPPTFELVPKHDASAVPVVHQFLAMELCGRSLYDMAMTKQLVGHPALFRQVTHGMLSALEFVHQQGIMHRDVKPSNFCMAAPKRSASSPFVRIIDMGLAKQWPLFASAEESHHVRFLGTPVYASNGSLRGDPQGCADDLEGLCYSILEMHMAAQLPWDEAFSEVLDVSDGWASASLQRLPEVRMLVWDQLVQRGKLPYFLTHWHAHVTTVPANGIPDYALLHALLDTCPSGLLDRPLPSEADIEKRCPKLRALRAKHRDHGAAQLALQVERDEKALQRMRERQHQELLERVAATPVTPAAFVPLVIPPSRRQAAADAAALAPPQATPAQASGLSAVSLDEAFEQEELERQLDERDEQRQQEVYEESQWNGRDGACALLSPAPAAAGFPPQPRWEADCLGDDEWDERDERAEQAMLAELDSDDDRHLLLLPPARLRRHGRRADTPAPAAAAPPVPVVPSAGRLRALFVHCVAAVKRGWQDVGGRGGDGSVTAAAHLAGSTAASLRRARESCSDISEGEEEAEDCQDEGSDTAAARPAKRARQADGGAAAAGEQWNSNWDGAQGPPSPIVVFMSDDSDVLAGQGAGLVGGQGAVGGGGGLLPAAGQKQVQGVAQQGQGQAWGHLVLEE